MKKKLENLPKEYFALKFTNPDFPSMSPGTPWACFIGCLIFYIMNLTLGMNSGHAVVKYFAVAVLVLGTVILLPAFYFTQKRINRHRVGYAYYNLLLFGQFRFCIICSAALISSAIISDGWLEPNTGSIINICYIIAAASLAEDAIVNIIFREIMKKRIADGAFKTGGSGFFGDMKHKNTIWAILVKISGVGMTLSLATIPLSKIFHFRWDSSYLPILATVMLLAVNWLIFLFAYCNALLLGRIHYMKKFECNDNSAEETEENK